jgi:AcrR family transcriptional regulator
VGRHPQPEIKQRLLDACTDYALEHGLPDRLEPLANAAGASSRMLIYHFGSRDDLLRAVLGRARHRQLEMFGDLLRVQIDTAYAATLSHAWATMTPPVSTFRVERPCGRLWRRAWLRVRPSCLKGR